MIPREDIDRIYAAARIEDVVSDYVSLRRRGANLIGLCPFHDEKTGSFTVSPAKGIFKCFGCGKAGNVVNFVMEYEQLTYPDALRQLAKKYHIDLHETQMTAEEKERENERESLFRLNEWANHWFQDTLHQTDEGRQIGMRYFVERGLSENIINKFQLGYSPEKNALYAAAKQAGYKDEYLEKTGLCGKSEHGYYDRFRDRVIFPLHTISGKIVGFAGRILKKKEHVGKYVNSPDSIIYSKQNELYGLYFAKQQISKQNKVFLVEGQMDVIAMHQAGIENVVSSGGTSLTHRQVVLLHRFADNVTVLYDGDAAGIKAALRGIDMLLAEGLKVKVVLLPDGEDPDSYSRKLNASDFNNFLQHNEQDFIHFKTRLLLQDAANDPIKKSNVTKDIIESISVIPDEVTRSIYIKSISEMLGIAEGTILADINALRKKKREDSRKIRENSTDNNATDSSDTKGSENKNNTVQLLSIRQSNKLDKNIRNLLQTLIRYGMHTLYQYDDGTTINVANFVINDLKQDQIYFPNETYQQIIDEFEQNIAKTDFDPEQYFKFHPNSNISTLTSQLIQEEHPLSKIYSKQSISENITHEVKMPTDADRLTDLVPQLLYELKLTIITENIKQIRLQLKHAQENNDYDAMEQLLQQLIPQEELRKQFCQVLNHRFTS